MKSCGELLHLPLQANNRAGGEDERVCRKEKRTKVKFKSRKRERERERERGA